MGKDRKPGKAVHQAKIEGNVQRARQRVHKRHSKQGESTKGESVPKQSQAEFKQGRQKNRIPSDNRQWRLEPGEERIGQGHTKCWKYEPARRDRLKYTDNEGEAMRNKDKTRIQKTKHWGLRWNAGAVRTQNLTYFLYYRSKYLLKYAWVEQHWLALYRKKWKDLTFATR